MRQELTLKFVAFFTLMHDAFQIVFAATATASQVASSGYPTPWSPLPERPYATWQVASSGYRRSAILINTIEVGVLVFVKLYNLFNCACRMLVHHTPSSPRFHCTLPCTYMYMSMNMYR